MPRRKHFFTYDIIGQPPNPFRRSNGNYYYVYTYEGRRIWRSLHTDNKAQAQERCYRMWHERQSEPAQRIVDKPAMLMIDLWDCHVSSERFRLLTPESKTKRQQRWNAFVSWCESRGIKHADHVSASLAAEYMRTFSERKSKTFNTYRSDLAAVFSAAKHMGNPFLEVAQRSTKRGEGASDTYRPFTDDEVKRILDAIATSNMPNASEWVLSCVVAQYTGLRFEDVVMLRWDEISDGVIELVPGKTATSVGKKVAIKLAPDLKDKLVKPRKPVVHVLPGLAKSYTKKLATRNFMRLLRGIGIADGEDGKTGFRSFRTMFVSEATKHGISIERLQGVLGHTKKEMSEHYDHTTAQLDLSNLYSQKDG